MNHLRLFTIVSALILITTSVFSQVILKGNVYNNKNKEPLPGATIVVQGMQVGATSDLDGHFEISDLKPGLYNILVSFTGFKTQVFHEIQTSAINPKQMEVFLEENVSELNVLTIKAGAFKKTVETPLSLRTISAIEAQITPGGVLDISKVMQSLPGVLPKPSFGYAIAIRGGASHENSFLLDGIEIPTINHFTVMGSTGGPNGLVNFDFIENAHLYSSAFPVENGGAVSAVLDMKLRDGRKDKIGGKFILGYTDYGLLLEGPLGKKANYILSYRKSFSEYYLKLFNVPILPAYSDFQFRTKIYLDNKNELTFIGIGGFDKYRLNVDGKASDGLLYNVGYIPEGDQTVYTLGANYKHYLDNSFYSLIVSTSQFSSIADKFKNNSGNEADRLLRYDATEGENKVRFEHHIYNHDVLYKYGVSVDQNHLSVNNYALNANKRGLDTLTISNSISYLNYGFFGSYNNTLFNEKLSISFGFRADASSLNESTSNPFDQISPRGSLTFNFTDKVSLNASSGLYYQLPPNVVLAYNQANSLKYIKAAHYNIGVEYKNNESYRFSVEFFSKQYSQYPNLLGDSISFANAVADYVVIGNQETNSTSEGRAYGMELFIQQKLKRNYWWMASYTYSVSEFKDKFNNYQFSSWDSRNIFNISAGKRWDNNWQLGIRWRYANGTPYTPYDLITSSAKVNWDVVNRGIFNYDELNSERLPSFHSMDLRVDKYFFFKKWNMNLFLDIQNFYGSAIQLLPYLTLERDKNLNSLTDPNDPERYLLQEINSDTGNRIPSIGVIAEF
jgi:hypothetical protein|tara:strand:- start:10447 stop:12810 length:2364 start_codon:yes stop_codon:yes gene_type:complete